VIYALVMATTMFYKAKYACN